MQAFKYWMPTKLFAGINCIEQNKEELISLGKKALLVTGKSSAKLSGALEDITDILNCLNIEYLIFNEVEENPSFETVSKGGKLAFTEQVDFIIGIGGGSPLDASKAIAALGANDIEVSELFEGPLANPVLPIVAVPITAGTGSEVTPYAILTDNNLETKRNFSTNETFPVMAFLDAKYTESLPYQVTVNTAIDFLSHAIEGYLSRRATPLSDLLAKEVISLFKDCYQALLEDRVTPEVREKLLYASMLAGVVISQTGTCMVHGMGYPLTYFAGIPHGRANGLVMAEFLRFNYQVTKEKTDVLLKLLEIKDIDEFENKMDSLLGEKESLFEEELKKFAHSASKVKAIQFTPRIPSEEDLLETFKKSF